VSGRDVNYSRRVHVTHEKLTFTAYLLHKSGIQTGPCFPLSGPRPRGTPLDRPDAARGARYNSGIRYAYQEGKTDRTVLVKSEDGMVNVEPEIQ
jgi:hypothetical protein